MLHVVLVYCLLDRDERVDTLEQRGLLSYVRQVNLWPIEHFMDIHKDQPRQRMGFKVE